MLRLQTGINSQIRTKYQKKILNGKEFAQKKKKQSSAIMDLHEK